MAFVDDVAMADAWGEGAADEDVAAEAAAGCSRLRQKLSLQLTYMARAWALSIGSAARWTSSHIVDPRSQKK